MFSFSLNKYHYGSSVQNHSTGLRMSLKYNTKSLKYTYIVTEVQYAHKTTLKRIDPKLFPLPLNYPQLVQSPIYLFTVMCQVLVQVLKKH